MSRRLAHNPESIDNLLVEVRNCIAYTDVQANPFFFLVKPTEECTSKYRLYRPESAVLLVSNLIFCFPIIFLEIFFASIISLFWTMNYSHSKLNQERSCDSLFVSHYTKAQSKSNTDVYYGTATQSLNSFVVYLNHTRFKSHQILNNFKQNEISNVFVNNKTLPLFATLKLHFQQFKVSFLILKFAVREKNLFVSQRRILIKGARFQHSRPTLANLILRDTLGKLIPLIRPKRMIITLEGHAHEAMLINLRDEQFSQMQIVAYQHAPIVYSQFNVKRVVSMLGKSDLVLTSGYKTQKFFLSEKPNARVEILGSPKFRTFEYQKKDLSRLRVLLTPEAAKESLIDLAYLARELSLTMPSALFVIRPHPDTSKKGMIHLSKLLNGLSNVQISELPLSADLKSSHVTLFRSSSAALEGMAFGSLPIHFELGGNGSLNPLFDTKFSVNAFYEYKGLCKYLNKLNLLNFQLEGKQREFFEGFLLYFSKYRDFKALVR